MRKSAFCAGAAAGPGTLAGAGSASGLLPDGVVRDTQALILQTEEVAATGRACQAFVRANNLEPR